MADETSLEATGELTVWRAKLFSERDDLCDDKLRDQARAYCRSAGVVGVGWGRWTLKAPDGAPLEEVLAEIHSIEGWKPGGDTVRRLAQDAHGGDLVWTRDSLGAYWLGRITGPWRFDGSTEASKWASTTSATVNGWRGHSATGKCRAPSCGALRGGRALSAGWLPAIAVAGESPSSSGDRPETRV